MSQLQRKPLKRGGNLKRKPLKRRGHKTTMWQYFRDKKFAKDKDEEGLIRCQDTKLGLPHCGISRDKMDLHHIKGREEAPDLYFADSNLVWLTRECHREAHNQR